MPCRSNFLQKCTNCKNPIYSSVNPQLNVKILHLTPPLYQIILPLIFYRLATIFEDYIDKPLTFHKSIFFSFSKYGKLQIQLFRTYFLRNFPLQPQKLVNDGEKVENEMRLIYHENTEEVKVLRKELCNKLKFSHQFFEKSNKNSGACETLVLPKTKPLLSAGNHTKATTL